MSDKTELHLFKPVIRGHGLSMTIDNEEAWLTIKELSPKDFRLITTFGFHRDQNQSGKEPAYYWVANEGTNRIIGSMKLLPFAQTNKPAVLVRGYILPQHRNTDFLSRAYACIKDYLLAQPAPGLSQVCAIAPSKIIPQTDHGAALLTAGFRYCDNEVTRNIETGDVTKLRRFVATNDWPSWPTAKLG